MAAALTCVFVSCASAPISPSAWTRPSTVDEFFDGSHPRVIAHRGFSGEAPENTLVAIERALDLDVGGRGIDMVEFDVLLSRDGHVVLIHDEHLERSTDGTGLVRDHDLDELRRLDAGSWFGTNSAGEDFTGERIPTLDEVFEAVGGRVLLNVEIKTEAVGDLPQDLDEAEREAWLAASLPGRVADLVRRHGLEEQVLVSSFDPRALDQMRRIAPEIARASLYEKTLHAGLTPSRVTAEVGARAFNVSRRLLEAAMLRDAAAAGIPVAVYTVNRRRQMRRLLDRGASALFTDRPDVMLDLLTP